MCTRPCSHWLLLHLAEYKVHSTQPVIASPHFSSGSPHSISYLSIQAIPSFINFSLLQSSPTSTTPHLTHPLIPHLHTMAQPKSRAPLAIGLAVAGGVGYYLYGAGGSPKAAEKQFEGTCVSIVPPALMLRSSLRPPLCAT